MIRKLLISVCLIFSAIAGMQAETVTMKEARKVARLFFNDAYGMVCPEPEYVFNGKRFTTDRLFTPFYVFNSPEGGFVIVSADNKAFPIIAYSLMPKGQGFDQGKLSTEDRELLTGYSRDIELIRFDSRYPDEAASAWENLPEEIHNILYSPSILADGYLRYRPDDSKMWVVRERAVEFPYEWPKTDVEIRLEKEEESMLAQEDEPFAFHESFVEENALAIQSKQSELEEHLRPTKPVIHNHGGAHFTIDMPARIEVADIYNAEGRLAKRIFFRNANSLPIDLSNLPNGFYFALLRDVNGSTTGIKLFR